MDLVFGNLFQIHKFNNYQAISIEYFYLIFSYTNHCVNNLECFTLIAIVAKSLFANTVHLK